MIQSAGRHRARAAGSALLVLVALVLVACSDRSGPAPRDALVRDDLLANAGTMMGWISEIAARGIRRPGYAADAWVEQWARDRFLELGLEDVTLDPVGVNRWEPLGCALEVWRDDAPAERLALPCFPVPFTAPSDGIEADIAFVESGDEHDVRDRIAVVDNPPLLLPQTFMESFATWSYDPSGEIPKHLQTILFAATRDHTAAGLRAETYAPPRPAPLAACGTSPR